MPIDRLLWKSPFSKIPEWPCPACRSGRVRLPEHDAQKGKRTREAREVPCEPGEAPEWDARRFALVTECDKVGCREVVSIIGWVEDYEGPTPDEDGDFHRVRFHIDAMRPAPIPITVPAGTPDRMIAELDSAASLYWLSPSAAGNALRRSIERLLDYKGIRKYPRTGPRRPIHLAQRIHEFEANDGENGQSLHAVRWLGNAGSHETDLRPDDVLDGFELIELVLENMFVGHVKNLQKKARQIVKRKGPL